MTIKKDAFGEPEMPAISGSEIEGVVDLHARGTDNIARPVLVNQDGTDWLNLSRADAKRLLDFLNEAIPYIDRSSRGPLHS